MVRSESARAILDASSWRPTENSVFDEVGVRSSRASTLFSASTQACLSGEQPIAWEPIHGDVPLFPNYTIHLIRFPTDNISQSHSRVASYDFYRMTHLHPPPCESSVFDLAAFDAPLPFMAPPGVVDAIVPFCGGYVSYDRYDQDQRSKGEEKGDAEPCCIA
jgi:hypothetical protein